MPDTSPIIRREPGKAALYRLQAQDEALAITGASAGTWVDADDHRTGTAFDEILKALNQLGSTGNYIYTFPEDETASGVYLLAIYASDATAITDDAEIVELDFSGVEAVPAKFTGITSLAHWLRALARKSTPDSTALAEINATGGTFDATTDALEANREKLDTITGTGVGPHVVTITVTSGGSPVVGAAVSLTGGRYGITDASGVVVFACETGSYTLAVTKAGYTHTPTTQVITATTAIPVTMTDLGIIPSTDPEQTTAFTVTRDGQGNVRGGVTITFALMSGPGADSYTLKNFPAVSNATTGVLQKAIMKNSHYRAKRGDGPWVDIPDTGSDDTFELPEINDNPGS
jgi:hypothetical protein